MYTAQWTEEIISIIGKVVNVDRWGFEHHLSLYLVPMVYQKQYHLDIESPGTSHQDAAESPFLHGGGMEGHRLGRIPHTRAVLSRVPGLHGRGPFVLMRGMGVVAATSIDLERSEQSDESTGFPAHVCRESASSLRTTWTALLRLDLGPSITLLKLVLFGIGLSVTSSNGHVPSAHFNVPARSRAARGRAAGSQGCESGGKPRKVWETLESF